ncbi:MAG TPA: hypothetical protein PLV92_19005, partial [Pirellulaceae bacterium]|nr:hypothetical protein [Pirellulaceae bacterium]
AAQRVAWAPNDLMLDYFDRLEERPDKADVRYVLALLLVRRRLLRHDESATARTDDDQLVLFCPRNEREYRVPAVLPDDERVKEIQQELSSLLFGDGQAMLDALAPPPSAIDPPELGLFTGEVSEDPSAEDLLTGLLAPEEEAVSEDESASNDTEATDSEPPAAESADAESGAAESDEAESAEAEASSEEIDAEPPVESPS